LRGTKSDMEQTAQEASKNAIRTVSFDGARMDKLTYAGLKALGAELSAVTVE
jgi:hypothetical protein